MSNYSKYSDINAVLNKAEKSLIDIENQYKKCLAEKNIPDDLLVDVKNCIDNLRSALDYLWVKIPNANKSGHFPICNSENDFNNKTQKLNQTISNVLHKYQSFNGDEWLSNFGYIRNKNNHITLIPQKRQETRRVTVSNPQGSVSWGSGVTFGGGVSVMGVPIDPTTQMPIPNNITETRVEIWVDFLFDGISISSDFPKNVSVLPFLKKSFETVKTIIQDIEKII
jgi:hypothetical protein